MHAHYHSMRTRSDHALADGVDDKAVRVEVRWRFCRELALDGEGGRRAQPNHAAWAASIGIPHLAHPETAVGLAGKAVGGGRLSAGGAERGSNRRRIMLCNFGAHDG